MTQTHTATRTKIRPRSTSQSSIPRQYRKNIHLCILFMDDKDSSPSRSVSASSSTNSSTPSVPHSESSTNSRTRDYFGFSRACTSMDAIHQSQYLRNLITFMRDPKQHTMISYDAKVLCTAITIWCALNILSLFLTSDPDTIEQKEDSINKLMLFLITILIIHKDVILCNGQSSLPMLLMFNFTVKMALQFLMNFTLSMESLNAMTILLILSFCTQRFTMDLFSPKLNGLNVTRSLIRSHLFYRGNRVRWFSFVLYSWFNSLLTLDLMDSLCVADGMRIPIRKGQRAVFVINDAVIVAFSVLVLWTWNWMKQIDLKQFKHSCFTLYVPEQLGTEIVVFLVVFVTTFGLCESQLSRLVVKNVVLPFGVVIVLFFNFLMR